MSRILTFVGWLAIAVSAVLFNAQSAMAGGGGESCPDSVACDGACDNTSEVCSDCDCVVESDNVA